MKAGHRIETILAFKFSLCRKKARAMKAGHRIETTPPETANPTLTSGARDEGGSPH
jgi:hypothetical protein